MNSPSNIAPPPLHPESPGDTPTENEPRDIILALSGGGFRATLFHLGVLAALRQKGLLGRVKTVIGISGGSITAAHLLASWQNYTGGNFADASAGLINLCRADIRGMIIRRLLLWPIFGRVRWLERYIVKTAPTLNNLKKPDATAPEGLFVMTDLRTGQPWLYSTSRKVLLRKRWKSKTGEREIEKIEGPKLDPLTAVAVSAAFPLLFPARTFNAKLLGTSAHELGPPPTLADGGIFDNLGTRIIDEGFVTLEGATSIIISDANRYFDDLDKPKKVWLTTRFSRSVDIMMNRIAEADIEALRKRLRGVTTHIQLAPGITGQDAFLEPWERGLRYEVSRFRTDLDCFSQAEIIALLYLGFRLGCARLTALRPSVQDASPGDLDKFLLQDTLPQDPGGASIPVPNYLKARYDAKTYEDSDEQKIGIYTPSQRKFPLNYILPRDPLWLLGQFALVASLIYFLVSGPTLPELIQRLSYYFVPFVIKGVDPSLTIVDMEEEVVFQPAIEGKMPAERTISITVRHDPENPQPFRIRHTTEGEISVIPIQAPGLRSKALKETDKMTNIKEYEVEIPLSSGVTEETVIYTIRYGPIFGRGQRNWIGFWSPNWCRSHRVTLLFQDPWVRITDSARWSSFHAISNNVRVNSMKSRHTSFAWDHELAGVWHKVWIEFEEDK